MNIPANQKVALYRTYGELFVKSKKVDLPKGDNYLIKVSACGICGSDLHTFRGNSSRNTFENWLKLGYADGHEYVGTIAAKGPNSKKFNVGQKVVAECTRHCHECVYCKKGLYNICIERKDLVWRGNGGFAEYATAPEHALHKININISDQLAALIEPAACSYRAFKKSDIQSGERVLVVGSGTIGLLSAQIIKTLADKDVTISVKYKAQAIMAEMLGITNILYSNEVGSEIADVVIDSVGNSASFNDSLKSVNRNGKISIVGSPVKNLDVALGNIVGKELTVKGVLTYAHEYLESDFQKTIDLISDLRIDPRPLVTHTFPQDEIQTAFKTALDKTENSIKVQIQY